MGVVDGDTITILDVAKAKRVGLRIDTNPIPPWEFRKAKIENMINESRTVADGGKDMILDGRYHILRQFSLDGTCLEMRYNAIALKKGAY